MVLAYLTFSVTLLFVAVSLCPKPKPQKKPKTETIFEVKVGDRQLVLEL
ncbi:MAG: hypothetical protein HC796_02380, partial [Synechococcaceae cyanobacterium RL_1_2]|nr:hypothetical protein [Synechococcaceae cyanobacterium RL_1_2]